MTSQKQKRWSRQEFFDLLDDEDLAALWEKWKLPQTEKMSRNADAFTQAVDARSTTSLVREVFSLKTATLRMLRDLLTFLGGHQSAARTTGCHLVLDEEFDFSAQQVNAVLAWSDSALQRHPISTWDELRQRFRSDIIPLFNKIDKYGAVEELTDEVDLVEAYIESQAGSSPEMEETVNVRYNEDGVRARKEYDEKLRELDNKLDLAAHADLPAGAKELLKDVTNLSRNHARQLEKDILRIRGADRRIRKGFSPKLTDDDHERWRRFVEGILFLSDIEESSSAVDILRMDLFRKRSQLYEVWIVVKIITLMKRIGCMDEMLSLHTTESGRVVWNLNYTKSGAPIARFVGRDGTQSYLFYQLFRAGEVRANMPDIVLMPSNRPDDNPIWILDPKHSERRSYSLADYREVGQRYQSTFAPRRTWIVDYYSRPELGADNPRLLADHVELIRDVSPTGGGYTYLLERLREFHGAPETTMAIIDISASFVGNFELVKADLDHLAAEGAVLADDIIWFSDGALQSSGCLDGLRQGTLTPPPELAGRGSQFGPVLQKLQQLHEVGLSPLSLRIYTDRAFNDVQIDVELRALQQRGVVGDWEVVDQLLSSGQ